MGRREETARGGMLYEEDGRDCEGREGCVGRTAETARGVRVVWGGRPRLPRGLEGCEGMIMWVGWPRLRGEGRLCGEDGRDCEGREGCVGRRTETAREDRCVGRMIGTAREGGLCGEDGRDCEGREGCVGRTAETARGGRLYVEDGRDCEGRDVVWGGRDCEGREGCVGRTAETARERGLSGEDGRDCQGGRLCGEDDRDCDGGRVM